MFNKRFLLLIGLIFIFVVIQPIFALTASSENYSVARFGTGVQATNLNSSDLTGRALSLANAGTRNAENDIHTVNIGFWANTSYHVTVSIISYTIYPNSTIPGSIIRLSISALNSESVWLVLTLPTGTNETINLTNNGDTYYTANSIGIYYVIFYANSSSGSLASAIDTFEITSSAIPPVTPPSGGGGTTIITCTYIWDCTSWSICSEGKQQRECKNIGNCTGTEEKPIETRECSDALFDVIINLKEVGLTQDKTLRFSVDLTEKKGVEKIDVQIKYSIINSNNNEIFSQVETRAIQGNLTYEKEISEIKLFDGDYILRVDILYGNLQRAFAEQRFRVRGRTIEIGEPASNIQKIMEFLKVNLLLLIIILLLIIVIILLIIIILTIIIPQIRKTSLKQKREQRKKNLIKRKIKQGLKLTEEGKLAEARLIYKKIKKTYNPDEDTNRKMYDRIMEFYDKIVKGKSSVFYPGLIAISVLFLFLLNLNITGGVINNVSSSTKLIISILLIIIPVFATVILLRKKFIELLSKVNNKHKKYSANSVLNLINKKVYSDNANYMGKISDVILGKNRIDSLKIKIDKKHKFDKKGVIISYKHVKSVGEIVVINEKVLEKLKITKS